MDLLKNDVSYTTLLSSQVEKINIDDGSIEQLLNTALENKLSSTGIVDELSKRLELHANEKLKNLESAITAQDRRMELSLIEWCQDVESLSEKVRYMEQSYNTLKTELEQQKSKNKEIMVKWVKSQETVKVLDSKLKQISEKISQTAKIENRISELETSVERALNVMFPRVEQLLTRCETSGSLNELRNEVKPMKDQEASSSHHRKKVSDFETVYPKQYNISNSHSIRTISTPTFSSVVANGVRTREVSISPLFNAIIYNDVNEVKSFLESETQINTCNENGFTALHIAADFGRNEIINLLIVRGADVNCVDSNGMSPVYNAVSNCHIHCLEILLHNGARVNIKSKDGTTPLHRAALCGDKATIQSLLRAGATCAYDNEGKTPLHWAAAWGSVDTTRALLEAGSRSSPSDIRNRTPLHWAVLSGREDTAMLLLMAGASLTEIRKNHLTPSEMSKCENICGSLREAIRNINVASLAPGSGEPSGTVNHGQNARRKTK